MGGEGWEYDARTDCDCEQVPVNFFHHGRVRRAGAECRQHVLVVLVVPDAENKIDGGGGMRLEQSGVGEGALVHAGDAHLGSEGGACS